MTQDSKRTRWLTAALFSLSLIMGPYAASGSKDQAPGLSLDDKNAIKTTIGAYKIAWLANDAKGVLKTFTYDAVLLPAHGAAAVIGIEAIEKYWFTPGGPPTTITGLDITVDEVSGNRTLAFARGLDSVAWTLIENGATRQHSHPGTYLNVMKKLPNGSWRIKVHMWDDGPEHVQ